MKKRKLQLPARISRRLQEKEQALNKKEAKKVGYPVLIKAASGGGGRGMKVALTKEELESAFNSAKNESKADFGDDRVYIERYLQNPRHIEVQIIADNKGNVYLCFERECSVQRRYQKVIEDRLQLQLHHCSSVQRYRVFRKQS